MTDRPSSARRVLRDPRRAALLDALLEHPDGLDVEQLAAVVEAHPNTVRWHLGVLAGAGLVSSRSLASCGPGRPRIRYSASAGAADAGGDEHRSLAMTLAHALAGLDDAPARAADAGRTWGRHVFEGIAGEPGDDAGRAALVDLLAVQGFEPELEGDATIALRRCPFHDLAAAHPEVICSLHHGLVAGALETLGGPLRLRALRPFVGPELCMVDLVADEPRAEPGPPA